MCVLAVCNWKRLNVKNVTRPLHQDSLIRRRLDDVSLPRHQKGPNTSASQRGQHLLGPDET